MIDVTYGKDGNDLKTAAEKAAEALKGFKAAMENAEGKDSIKKTATKAKGVEVNGSKTKG